MIDLCRKCERVLKRHLNEARKLGLDLSWFCRRCRKQLEREAEKQ